MNNPASVYIPVNRLVTALSSAEYQKVNVAVENAKSNLMALKPEVSESIRQRTEVLTSFNARLQNADGRSILEDVYASARGLIGLGAVAELKGIDRAASTLCDIVDGLIESDRSNLQAVLVGIESIRIICSGAPEPDIEQLLESLETLAQKYTAHSRVEPIPSELATLLDAEGAELNE